MKPSELLEQALEDLIKVEQDPRYQVDMSKWHEPRDGKCLVCLAGSWLAVTKREPDNVNIGPYEYITEEDKITFSYLSAINEFRLGMVVSALRQFRIEAHNLKDRLTAPYEDRQQFEIDMRQIVTELKQEGV